MGAVLPFFCGQNSQPDGFIQMLLLDTFKTYFEHVMLPQEILNIFSPCERPVADDVIITKGKCLFVITPGSIKLRGRWESQGTRSV